jgi:hypothetical protein
MFYQIKKTICFLIEIFNSKKVQIIKIKLKMLKKFKINYKMKFRVLKFLKLRIMLSKIFILIMIAFKEN